MFDCIAGIMAVRYLIILVMLILTAVSGPVFAEDYFEIEKVEDPDIYVYKPVPVVEGETYPVLYLIHGRWQQPTIWEDEIGLSDALEQLYKNNEIVPFYIILPHDVAYLEDMYASSFHERFLNEIVPYVEENYPVDKAPEKTAIGGISRGAQWAQYIAFEEYGRYRHVGVHSPANAFYSLPKIYGIIRDHPDVPQLRIRIDIGNGDNAVRIGAEFSKQLLDLFYPHEFVLGSGGHDAEYWKKNMPVYLKWYSDGFQMENELETAALPEFRGGE